jgi:hypothetical protein
MDEISQICLNMDYPELIKYNLIYGKCNNLMPFMEKVWNIIHKPIKLVPQLLSEFLKSSDEKYLVKHILNKYYSPLFSKNDLINYLILINPDTNTNYIINNIVLKYIGSYVFLYDEEYLYYENYKFLSEKQYYKMINEISKYIDINFNYIYDTLYELFIKITEFKIIDEIDLKEDDFENTYSSW